MITQSLSNNNAYMAVINHRQFMANNIQPPKNSATNQKKKYSEDELKQLNLFYQQTIPRFTFAYFNSYIFQSHSSIYKSKRQKNIEKNNPIYPKPKKNYQIVESKRLNGFKTLYKYYIDGIECDAFGRIPGDPGFTGLPVRPIYPPSVVPHIKTSRNKRWANEGVWGLDSGTNLQIIKNNTHYEFVLDTLIFLNKERKKIHNLIDQFDHHLHKNRINDINNFDVSKLKTSEDYLNFLYNMSYSKNNKNSSKQQMFYHYVNNPISSRHTANALFYPPTLYNNSIPYNEIAPSPVYKRATLNGHFSINTSLYFSNNSKGLTRTDQSYNSYLPVYIQSQISDNQNA